MHKYFNTADNRTIAVRLTGIDASVFKTATERLTPIAAPVNARAKRISGEIATCVITTDGRIGSL